MRVKGFILPTPKTAFSRLQARFAPFLFAFSPPKKVPLDNNPNGLYLGSTGSGKSFAAKRELVSLQRRCSNNLNQVAVHANTYGIYEHEIKGLQKDYAELWGPLSELLKQLSMLVEL